MKRTRSHDGCAAVLPSWLSTMETGFFPSRGAQGQAHLPLSGRASPLPVRQPPNKAMQLTGHPSKRSFGRMGWRLAARHFGMIWPNSCTAARQLIARSVRRLAHDPVCGLDGRHHRENSALRLLRGLAKPSDTRKPRCGCSSAAPTSVLALEPSGDVVGLLSLPYYRSMGFSPRLHPAPQRSSPNMRRSEHRTRADTPTPTCRLPRNLFNQRFTAIRSYSPFYEALGIAIDLGAWPSATSPPNRALMPRSKQLRNR